jgi:hypothetical protein
MNKLLIILFLFTGSAGYSQIVVGTGGSSSTFSAGTTASLSVSFVAGKPTILIVESQSTATPNIPTLTTVGYTWIQLATVTTNSNTSRFVRQTAFVCYPTVTAATVTTNEDWAGQTQTWNGWAVFNVTAGVNVRAFQSATVTGNGINPAITLNALQGNNNSVVAAFLNDFNPFGGTAEAGWTKAYDSGGGTHGTNGVGYLAVQRDNHSDNTVVVTDANSGPWCGIAIELRRIQSVFTL